MITNISNPEDSTTKSVIETLVFLPLTVAALFGNSLVLTAVYRNPRLRTSAHYFIATLALTDLLSACISQPLTVTVLISGRWMTGTFGCHIHGFFNSFLTYTSSYTMVLTAVNRYFKVVRPRSYTRYFTRKRVLFQLASIWIVNLLVVLTPVLCGWAQFGFYDIFKACALRFSPSREVSWAAFEFTTFSLIPMVIISICHYKVSKTLRRHNHVLVSLRSSNTSIHVDEIRVTKTLFMLVFAFFACMFIGFIMVVVCRIATGFILSPVGYSLIFLITLTTAINPILYTCTSKVFRKEFYLIFKCKRSNSVRPWIISHPRENNTTINLGWMAVNPQSAVQN